MKRIGIATLLFALAGALLNHAAGEPAPRPQEADPLLAAADGGEAGRADAMQRDLGEMRRSLHDIATLLAAALGHQELSVLMSRIELKQRRLQPLEDSLRKARGDLENTKEERNHLADMLEMFREQAGKEGPDAETLGTEIERGRKQLDRLEEREATLHQRIIELEDDLARNGEDIATLEEMVDARLGLR